MYPEIPATPPAVQPTAPPSDEGYLGSSEMSDSSTGSRGVIRPHSGSPFQRNVLLRTVSLQEEIDIESISCLLEFAKRGINAPDSASQEEEPMVRTFKALTPTTPSPAPRPQRPPRIASRRILPVDTPRPRPLRSSPPAAALGAPPVKEEEEMDLPDIPDTPQSPAASDITVLRLVLFLYLEVF